MDQGETQTYDYRIEAGPMKLLGILMILLGPITLVMSFQAGDSSSFIGGVGISGPYVPWVMRLIAIVLVWFGILMTKSAITAAKKPAKITVTNDEITLPSLQSYDVFGAIPFKTLTEAAVIEANGKKSLKLVYPTRVTLLNASQMNSIQEFDEMAATVLRRKEN